MRKSIEIFESEENQSLKKIKESSKSNSLSKSSLTNTEMSGNENEANIPSSSRPNLTSHEN